MIFLTESMKLKVTGVILSGDTNDVLLCESIPEIESGPKREGEPEEKDVPERNGESKETSLLWIVKDRAVIRYLMEPEHALPWITRFPNGEQLCIQMPYDKRRSLFKFGQQGAAGEEEREQLYRDIIILCMTARLPPPILLLLIEQRLFQVHRDGSLYFIYELNLAALNVQALESDCVKACAKLLLDFVDTKDKRGERLHQLTERKLDRGNYLTFLDLYLDFKRPGIKKTGLYLSDRFKTRAFYLLAVLAAIALIFLLAVIVSQVIFGNVPFFRLFMDNAQKIGTEVLGK